MDDDITIRIPTGPADASVKHINEKVSSIEDHAEQTGKSAGQKLGKGMASGIEVTVSQASQRAQDRIVASAEKAFSRMTAFTPKTPQQQLTSIYESAIKRLEGAPEQQARITRVYQESMAAADQYTRSSAAAAEQTAKTAAAFKQQQEFMRNWEAGLQRLNRHAAEQRTASEQATRAREQETAKLQQYARQLDLAGRSPLDRQLRQMAQEHERVTAGLDKSTSAYKKLNQQYLEARKRTLDVSKETQSFSSNLNTAIERLGAAFVAYQAMNLVFRQGLIETSKYAAQTETMRIAVDAAAQSNNLSATAMHAQEAAIKRLGITTREARESLLRMTVAQLDTTAATKLARLAQDTAIIGMMNSSQAFEQLIYGLQSGQVRVLRTIGINVQFQDSYERLARAIGKNVLDLSEEEKAQARLNSVLEVAPRYFGLYEKSMESAGKRLTSLQRYADEARLAIGKKFQDELKVTVDLLTEMFKFLEKYPEVGVGTGIALGGAAAATAAKFMLGTGAAVATAKLTITATTVYLMSKAIDYGGEKIRSLIDVAGMQPTSAADLKKWDALGKLPVLGNIIELMGLKTTNYIDMLPTLAQQRRDIARPVVSRDEKTGAPISTVVGTAIAEMEKSTYAIYERKFNEALERVYREEFITGRINALEEKRRQALSDRGAPGALQSFQQATAEKIVYEAELDRIKKAQEEAEKAQELAKKGYEIYRNQVALRTLAAQQGDSLLPGQLQLYRGENMMPDIIDSVESQRDRTEKYFAKAMQRQIDYTDDVLTLRADTAMKVFDEEQSYLDATHNRALLLLNEEAADTIHSRTALIERKLQIDEEYNSRTLALARDRLNIEFEMEAETLRIRQAAGMDQDLVTARFEALIEARRQGILSLENATARQSEELQINASKRISSVIREEQLRVFNDLKNSFESLFDAAFESSRSFLSALKRMLIAMFLTPLKEGMANVVAEMFTGVRAPGGGSNAGFLRLGGFGGGTGSVGGLLGMAGVAATSTGGMPSFGGGGMATAAVGGGRSGIMGGLAGIAGLKSLLYNTSSIHLGAAGSTTAAGIGGLPGALAGFATSPVGGMAGALLGYLGLSRGGLLGTGLTAGGGALTGAFIGNALFPGVGAAAGAGIGAVVGGIAGLVRMLFKGAEQKLREKIKSTYGVNIDNRPTLQQILGIAQSSFGGNLDMAIRSKSIQDLILLYAESTGQTASGITQRQATTMSQTYGALSNISALGVKAALGTTTSSSSSSSSANTLPSITSTAAEIRSNATASSRSGQTIVIPLQIDSKLVGNVIIQGNGRVLTSGVLSAMKGSHGRRELAVAQTSPNTVLA